MTVRDTAALRAAAASRSPAALPPRRFLGDAGAPGLLHAAVLRSPHPHARILSVSLDAARRRPGVHAVIAGADLPTAHRLGIQVRDRPALAVDVVRHVGEPVAAVAADSLQAAREALAAIEVRWQVLPAVDDAARALAPGAPALHAGGNLLHATRFERGDLEAAFARCAHVVESEVSTPRQVHAYLELESALAVPGDDGTLHVLAPCQGPHAIRQDLAALLGWPVGRIEVTGSPLGGSYGGKDDMHAQAIAALLAVRSGRPVRLAWSRAESMAAGMKRHPFVVRMRTGCTADGRLLAHDVSMLLDTGAYASHGPEVLDTAHEHAPGAYRWEALRVVGRLAYTSNGIAGAFRGFGALQTSTALELQIDALARRAGIDPIAFRARNVLGRDDPGPLGQPIAPLPDLHAVLAQIEAARAEPLPGADADDVGTGAAAADLDPAADAPRWVRGRGCALVVKSEGFAIGGPNAAGGRLGRLADGAVELRVGLSDMGQGLSGAARDLLRAALDAQPAFVGTPLRTSVGLTERTPSAGPTSASRGTHILAKLVAALVPRLAAACAEAAELAEVWVEAEVAMPEAFSEHGPAHAIFGACGALADVSVDRWTGRVRVDRVTVVPSVGPVVSPAGYLSQLEGSVPMAAGFVVLEDLPAEGGRFRASNLDGYLVPTLADAPRVAVRAIDAPIADDDALPRGIGESALNAIAPAIANAIAEAAGAMPTTLPVSPAWLRDALDASATARAAPVPGPAAADATGGPP